ncbi:MAG: hypothetical protein LBO72_10060 [Helicobacteraceae bacterium]|jgi:hypothetical protein|nr:hypothetical protein [Helicobacteraceae bacterium]
MRVQGIGRLFAAIAVTGAFAIGALAEYRALTAEETKEIEPIVLKAVKDWRSSAVMIACYPDHLDLGGVKVAIEQTSEYKRTVKYTVDLVFKQGVTAAVALSPECDDISSHLTRRNWEEILEKVGGKLTRYDLARLQPDDLEAQQVMIAPKDTVVKGYLEGKFEQTKKADGSWK